MSVAVWGVQGEVGWLCRVRCPHGWLSAALHRPPLRLTTSWALCSVRFILSSFAMSISVPATLEKEQAAKEIGHHLAHERPKFGHNLVRKRQQIEHSLERERPNRAQFYVQTHNKFGHNPAQERNKMRAQFCGRSMKTWTQICKHCTVHQLSENTKTEIKCKIFNFIFFHFGQGTI